MAAETDSSADLTADDLAFILTDFDADLNSIILQGQLHGIYTGIVVFTLWNIYTKKWQPIKRAMVVVIVILHVTATINLALNWSYLCIIYIKHGQSFIDKYLATLNPNNLIIFMDITGIVSTICADSAMIWCCWTVWEQRWPVAVLPILFLISGIVFRAILAYEDSIAPATDPLYDLLVILCITFVLATIIWCTLMIILRIYIVGHVSIRSRSRFKVYRHIIEIVVESAALYAISLLLYMILVACQTVANYYMDTVVEFSRGIAPTLLIMRVAAGHAQLDDSWEGSVMSSLQFGQDSEQIGSQGDASQSVTVNNDLEILLESDDHLEGVSEWPVLSSEDSV